MNTLRRTMFEVFAQKFAFLSELVEIGENQLDFDENDMSKRCHTTDHNERLGSRERDSTSVLAETTRPIERATAESGESVGTPNPFLCCGDQFWLIMGRSDPGRKQLTLDVEFGEDS